VGFSIHNLGALFCKGFFFFFFFWLGASSVSLTRLKAGLALPIFIHNMALSLRWVGIDCRLYRRNNNDIKPNFSSNLYIYVREELIIDMIIFFHCKYHIGRVPFDVLKRKPRIGTFRTYIKRRNIHLSNHRSHSHKKANTIYIMLVVLLHLVLAGSLRSNMTDNQDKFTPPLPSGEIECWAEKKNIQRNKERNQNLKLSNQTNGFLNYRLKWFGKFP
jgi:hypothetical protein